MRLLAPYLAMLASAAVCAAQSGARSRFDPPQTGGVVTFEAHQDEPVQSLDQLIRMSDLIIQGTVIGALPPFHASPSIPEFIETNSLIRVDGVLRGTLAAGSNVICLVQMGGKLDSWDVRIIGDPLVALNERYVLFLAADARTKVPNTSGHPRFYAIGNHTGRVAVEDSKIRFQKASFPQLHVHDGISDTEFVDLLRARFAALFPEIPKYFPDWKSWPWAPGAKKPN
jgi:hypothetical protein